MEPEPIFTRADGTPVPGHPGTVPDNDAPAEERVAWLFARNEYRAQVYNLIAVEAGKELARKLRRL